jgi:hypothetical protein
VGTRSFWVDPLPGGVLEFPPFIIFQQLICARPQNYRRNRLHFRVSGLPLTRTRYTSLSNPSGQQDSYNRHPQEMTIRYAKLLKSYELPTRAAREFSALKRKNPGSAFGHQPGFSGDQREVPVIQVTSRFYFGKITSYHSFSN